MCQKVPKTPKCKRKNPKSITNSGVKFWKCEPCIDIMDLVKTYYSPYFPKNIWTLR